MKPSEGEKWSNNGVSQLKHQHYAIHNLLTYLYDVDGKNRRSMHLVDALGVDSRMPYASITNDLAQYNKTDNQGEISKRYLGQNEADLVQSITEKKPMESFA
ncbi:8978_t:CDS:2, partial [Funneliformis mosseae]